jgi:hypothetical protein
MKKCCFSVGRGCQLLSRHSRPGGSIRLGHGRHLRGEEKGDIDGLEVEAMDVDKGTDACS